jgi:hypothetical protein
VEFAHAADVSTTYYVTRYSTEYSVTTRYWLVSDATYGVIIGRSFYIPTRPKKKLCGRHGADLGHLLRLVMYGVLVQQVPVRAPDWYSRMIILYLLVCSARG